MSITVAVAGASGRLGRVICEVVRELDGFELGPQLTSSSTAHATFQADLLVDATTPEVSEQLVTGAARRGINVLVGTSGWSAERIARLESTLREASSDAGVLVVPNFSLGSVLGTAVAAAIAPYFAAVEIVETHHAAKVDSPSGTAVRTAERVAEHRGTGTLSSPGGFAAPHTDQPARGELVAGIPVHSLRLPGVVAKQEVIFSGLGESLTITHDTVSDAAYRAGIAAALRALPSASGVTVGLDQVLGVQISVGSADA